MRGYRLLLMLLALALVAAGVAVLVGSDPGYVLVQLHGRVLETSLVFAIIALFGAAGLLYLVLRLAAWPFVSAARRARRVGRMRHARGMLALAEGRPKRAGNLLQLASRLRSLRLAALLGAHRAAVMRGDARAEGEIIERLSREPDAEPAATVLHADGELAQGRAGTAIELLLRLEHAGRLPPTGRRVLADALAARGRAREALNHALALRRLPPMPQAVLERWHEGLAAQALAQATDTVSLEALWAELPKTVRRANAVVAALARRSRELRQPEPARRELEAALKRGYSTDVIAAYGTLTGGDLGARLKVAEGFLPAHPASAELLLALGRISRAAKLWGKAEDYLHRALSAGADAAAWQELGLTFLDQNDTERASRAFANAIAVTRAEPASPLSGRSSRADFLAPVAVAELRDEHGVPRLP